MPNSNKIKKWILNNLFNKSNQLQITSLKYKNLLKTNKDYILEIENSIKTNSLTFSQKCYCYLNDIHEHKKCKSCGKETKFTTQKENYFRIYCSSKCSGKDSSSYRNMKIISLEEVIKKINTNNTRGYIFTNSIKFYTAFINYTASIKERIFILKNNISKEEYNKKYIYLTFNKNKNKYINKNILKQNIKKK